MLIASSIVLVVIAMVLCLWRLLRGPTVADRVLALDTLYLDAMGLLVLLGIQSGSRSYFEIALMIAALGFVGTVAIAHYLRSGRVS